ncbi:PKD-like domain-containing protein [Flavobacterium sp. W20_MBD1_R3]|uniref:PKD-like domain-containing protein n=1 Tax=Flavobacterium sp. W20_MBD1_R3 TaxID=3240278 RepID=UPI003F8E73A3
MKIHYKNLFLFVLLYFNFALAFSSNTIADNTLLQTAENPSGQITGNATVCFNAAAPVIKFEVKNDDNGPYTFEYTVNSLSQTVKTNNTDKSVTVSQPTNSTGIFTYVLQGIKDRNDKVVALSNNDKVIIIVKALPVVDFTFTNNACSGTAVQFNTTNEGDSYTWNFGDGSTSSQKNPSHIFTSLGCAIAPFNVTLTVTDAYGCSGTIIKTITIFQQPEANFIDNSVTYNPLNTSNQFNNCNSAGANPNYTVSVVPSTSNSDCITGYSVIWQIGGTPEIFTTFPFTHTYTALGAFTMAITAIGNNNCSTTKKYIVKNESNPAGGLVSPGSTTNLCAPTENLLFTIANWALNSPGTIYSIDYGDDSPMLNLLQSDLMQNNLYYNSANPSLSLNYPVPHIYSTSSCPNASITATLKISNSCGTTNSTISPIVILRPPTSNFTNSPKACVTTCVQFTNTSTPASNESCTESTFYEWNFGDGSSIYTITAAGTPNPPCHKYTNPGDYTITLTTYGYCGKNVKTSTICIEPQLLPDFTIDNTVGCAPQSIVTTNTTATTNYCTPPTYEWSVSFLPSSCGSTIAAIPNQTTTNASFNFDEPGIYSIKLTASNSCSPSQSITKTVTIKEPPRVTITQIAPLCQIPGGTTINPKAIIDGCGTTSPLTYEWSFPSGAPATATTADPGDISYTTSGNFSYTLKVTNECGTTTTSSSFVINQSPTITGNLFSCIGTKSQLNGSPTAATSNPWISSNNTIATVSSTGLVTGVSAGSTTITFTNNLGCTTTALFTVNPSPAVTFSIPNQTICSGDTSALVTLSSVADATLSWTAIQPTGISEVVPSGTNTIPAQTLINNTTSNIVVTYNATATVSSGATCAGAVFTYTITVKPKPFIAANMTAVICSGLPFTVSPTNGAGNLIPTGTTYSWAAPALSVGVSGGTLGTNQNVITGTLTNSMNIIQKATYTVFPSFNGCAGSPFDVEVSVNPKPDVNPTPDVVLCAGETSTLINFSGNISESIYNWSSSTTSIGIAVSGNDVIPTFTAINTGLTPIIATVTVTPSADGCTGVSKTFKVTVNPRPSVNPITNLVKCNGTATGAVLFTGSVNGTTYDWTNDTPSIGLPAIGSGNITSFIATNNGTSPILATITVTPKANGCFGTKTTFTITVNPTPTVDLLSDQTVCNGQQTTAVLFSGAIISNTIYNWSNTSPTIGIGASGVGAIPAFTAINNGTTPIVATITVTPSLNGCLGVSTTFTITINPSPAVTFTPSNQIICSGSSSVAVNLTSTAGTNFTWTADLPAGITGISPNGTSTIPSQTLINSTNLPVVVTYLATAESTGSLSCQGITYPYTITVNPVPAITTEQAQTICSNTAFSIIPLNGGDNIVPVGTTYSWVTPVISGGISGGIAASNQTSINGTLINTTATVQTATYTVIPKSGFCNGNPFTVVITVNPSPKVVFSAANQTRCSGSDSLPILLSSTTTGNITFNWNANIPAGITGAAASGTDMIPTQTLANSTSNPVTIIYTATATIENNGISCTSLPFEYKIIVNPDLVTSGTLLNYNGFNVSAVGATDGAIDVTVTGGSGVYTYLWSGPISFSAVSQDIKNVAAGAYSLTINDGLCNPIVLNFTLTSPLPLIIEEDLAAHTNILCFSYLTGAIKVDITQESVGPYDYVLILQGGGIINTITDSSATTYTFSSLEAGIYDIKVIDVNGNAKTISGIVITQPSGITASTTQTNVSCAGSATGSATVTANGGNGTLSYSWNTIPSQTTETVSGLATGTYIVTITDTNSCSIQKQVTITEPSAIVTSVISQTNVLCFGDNTGSATVTASGGSGTVNYSWDTIPVQTTATVTGLAAAVYNVTVTDENGCQKVQAVIITQPSGGLSSVISNSIDVSCFGGNDGTATATVSAGTAPYSYSWNTVPVQTLATATGLVAGNYDVLITDVNGCSTTTTVSINEPIGMTATITAQINVFCSGNSTGSATVTATGGTMPYSYSWNTLPVQTLEMAENLPKGSYTVIITDAKGCTAKTQVTITEPNGIVIEIASQTNVDCFGNNTGAVTVSASGGAGTLRYAWDTNPIQTTASLTGLIAGTYNLTITDANNCTKIQQVTITEPDQIIIATVLEKDITCFNDADGAIDITITGGTINYTFAWTKDGIPFATTEDLINLSPGEYVVTVSDANNCGPKTSSFTITQPPILAVNLINQTNILCFGDATGVINVDVTGGTPASSGYVFDWSGPNGFSSSIQNPIGLFVGIYNLVVSDNSGCFKTLTVTLTQPTAISITAATTPITCYGANNAAISLTIAGGVAPYTFEWSNLGGGAFQENLSAGDYLVTVTDANNCKKTLNVNIPEAPLFTVNPVLKNISCFGAKDGSIRLNFLGGIAPVKLVWDDDAVSGTTRNNLGPGSYTVTIVDGKPCTIKRTFIILEPQMLVLSANITNAFNCDDANSGAINLVVAGGTAPFKFAWSNGTITEDLLNVPAGNYLVTVTDSNGCSKQGQYSVNRPPPLQPGVVTKTEVDCETKNVQQTFVAQVSGGVPPYILAWSSGTVSGVNNEMMKTNQNGTALLYVTDALGCKVNYAFDVNVPVLGTPSFDSNSYAYSVYGLYSINDPIQFTNTATGDFVSVVWDFGDGTLSSELNPIHVYINPKEYVVTQTVTYPFGCVYVQKITFIVEKGYLLIVPNAFTPNNDTVNDRFRPVTKALKNIHLDVYDTWGSLIYSETGDILRGWDAKIKGLSAENGNYYCKVSGETFYGTVVNENHPFVLIK